MEFPSCNVILTRYLGVSPATRLRIGVSDDFCGYWISTVRFYIG